MEVEYNLKGLAGKTAREEQMGVEGKDRLYGPLYYPSTYIHCATQWITQAIWITFAQPLEISHGYPVLI